MSGASVTAAPQGWGAASASVRAAARRRIEELGPPTTALEDWRYVQLLPPAPLDAPLAAHDQAVERQLRLCGASAPLVLLDGVLLPIEDGPAVVAGITGGAEVAICRLSDLSGVDAEALAQRWQEALASDRDISRAWALAELDGGLRMRIRGAFPNPLELILLSSGGASGAAIEIELEREASAQLRIQHVALGASRAHLSLGLRLGQGARLEIAEVQHGPAAARAQLLTVSDAHVARDAQLTWVASRQGLQLGRGRVDVELAGSGAAFHLAAVASLRAQRQWHDLTRVDHRVGMTTSSQLIRTIADGGAIGSYDGVVRIHPHADGAAARQRHQSLLLHPKGRVDSRPQLDIAADEVTAGHGSSIGHLAEDELLYLRMRGLGAAEARTLLVQGFAVDITARLPPEMAAAAASSGA
jgi:Fe-S cluster assembly protein SufD